MSERHGAQSRRAVLLWCGAFALLAAAVIVHNLTALDLTPPGMYIDESSIGYNAWAIAQHGVDEHGYAYPLYFEAFGEYKNPVYIYTLAALLKFLPLSPVAERIPAALYGTVVVLFVGLAAWRITRNRPITLCLTALAAVTPWIVQESRVGFEVIAMVASLSMAVWCLSNGRRTTPRQFGLAGVCFAVSIIAYSAGRVEVFLFAVAFLVIYRRARIPGWWRMLVPVVAGYAVVGVYALMHPGALTAEFSIVNIATDHPGLPTLVMRFLSNYGQEFSPDFLFIHGDPNLRHNTDYAGMLLVAMLPLLLAGLVVCWRRRREALPVFTVACILLGPISEAMTVPSPHALRGAVMIPFLFLLAAYGTTLLRELAPQLRMAVAAVLVCGAMTQSALYFFDAYTAYPFRASLYFDTGVPQAITTAHQDAAGHTVWLSEDLEQVYIQALFALQPAPPTTPMQDDWDPLLAELDMQQAPTATILVSAKPGDLAVLPASDPAPPDAQLLAAEDAPPDPDAPGLRTPLVDVYRLE